MEDSLSPVPNEETTPASAVTSETVNVYFENDPCQTHITTKVDIQMDGINVGQTIQAIMPLNGSLQYHENVKLELSGNKNLTDIAILKADDNIDSSPENQPTQSSVDVELFENEQNVGIMMKFMKSDTLQFAVNCDNDPTSKRPSLQIKRDSGKLLALSDQNHQYLSHILATKAISKASSRLLGSETDSKEDNEKCESLDLTKSNEQLTEMKINANKGKIDELSPVCEQTVLALNIATDKDPIFSVQASKTTCNPDNVCLEEVNRIDGNSVLTNQTVSRPMSPGTLFPLNKSEIPKNVISSTVAAESSVMVTSKFDSQQGRGLTPHLHNGHEHTFFHRYHRHHHRHGKGGSRRTSSTSSKGCASSANINPMNICQIGHQTTLLQSLTNTSSLLYSYIHNPEIKISDNEAEVFNKFISLVNKLKEENIRSGQPMDLKTSEEVQLALTETIKFYCNKELVNRIKTDA